ncbi:hypothetical protein BDZ94DRAFT_257238 [Collybia nuda]|uniref:DUF6534 domain-containing protein n=1 Tax=Collybia nuda TaxID=64659 RepID=A0A9P6CDN8_9AGAR|nr:hypothetical protein BDZ94DRAFT_257238 [Collybia nuda]
MEKSAFNPVADENLGAMMIGLALSLVLFGVIIIQSYTYYQRFGHDRAFIKVLVIAVLSLEIMHSLTITFTIYRNTVTFSGLPTSGPNSYPLTTSVIFEVLITAIVQGFFAFRIYHLSGTLYISLICWTLSLLRLGGGLALAAEGYFDVSRVPNTVLLTTTYAWLITMSLIVGAFVDVLIAASLCYYLKRMVTPESLKPCVGNPEYETSQIVDGLINWIVQTGLITSVASIVVVIAFHVRRYAEIWFAIYMVTAKLYSNSFFVSLNLRRHREDVLSMASSLRFQTMPPMDISVSMVRGASFRLAYDDTDSIDSSPTPPKVSLNLGSDCHLSGIDLEARQNPSPPRIAVLSRVRY